MIYLDHASATPVSKKILERMLPYFSEKFFNPSAPYLSAKRVREDYESAKQTIANLVGAKGNDLVITSGATEANALAFTAVSMETLETVNNASELLKTGQISQNSQEISEKTEQRCLKTEQNLKNTLKSPKILVLETEHASVLENAKKYALDSIKVTKTGLIDLSDLKKKLSPEVELVSVSLANNELGTIQPLSEIAQILKEERLSRLKSGNPHQLLLHSDASQGLALLDINVSRLGVDLLTLNSAKISGPKGVGALYVGHGVRLNPLILGGGQERNLRSGTENIPGVIGFAAACEQLKNPASLAKKYKKLSDILKSELENSKILPFFLGDKKSKLSNFLPLCFPGLDAERIIYKLEEREIYLSTGAACAASKGKPSHVLRAIGLSPEEIAGSLRISLGVLNTEENVREAGKALVEVVNHECERISRS